MLRNTQKIVEFAFPDKKINHKIIEKWAEHNTVQHKCML